MNPPQQYPVVITNVREVALGGVADLAYWNDHLSREGLFAYDRGGCAEFMITAIEAKWLGLTFREFSISVVASKREDGSTMDGAYLIHAFNSLRPFAFIERSMFSTPYYAGKIALDERVPACVEVADDHGLVFRATMGGRSSPVRREDSVWENPIYLPTKPGQPRRYFYARLAGEFEVYEFAGSDALTLNPSPLTPAIGWLVESGFRVTEWRLRGNATHGKGKTVIRA